MIELIGYIIVRGIVKAIEMVFLRGGGYYLKSSLKKSRNYRQWKHTCLKLDKLEKRDKWKTKIKSRYYNWELVMSLLSQLKRARDEKDVESLMKIIGTILSNKDICGVMNENIYCKTYIGTKHLVKDFISEIIASLKYLDSIG
eukprot:CAMPEP_0174273644 /NCGR_PEP_ID=MMETSP0439-20130205/55293_1 /TAXON_ID=0 /ORGANISM="Stereomyxa ramosa, Strain Chinc5" /LENGTH=142 /DNA_ID=CAMNT_0015364943 /DNA_START=49 /DNA_END=474 /DNA_ORIENTATION=-